MAEIRNKEKMSRVGEEMVESLKEWKKNETMRSRVGGEHKRSREREWEKRRGGGGGAMSHHQATIPGGLGSCGGGSVTQSTEGFLVVTLPLCLPARCGGGWKTIRGCHWDTRGHSLAVASSFLLLLTQTCTWRQ
ncbi:hypothetical protein ILYODFUR_018884 [Ilyodon furcidens]|uniref:Uncharacterized protein n=1 Tax=Ilyodon furcidens TaxID=33524 RepID=A0ABV0UUC9_9TELE